VSSCSSGELFDPFDGAVHVGLDFVDATTHDARVPSNPELAARRSIVAVLSILCQVEREHACEQQQPILALSNLDAVRVANRKPLLRYPGDHLVAASNCELMVEKAAVYLHVVRPGDVNGEAVDDWPMNHDQAHR
jgi:hypothetical protein